MNSVQQLGTRSVMWDFVPLLSRKLMRISNVAVSYFMYLNSCIQGLSEEGGKGAICSGPSTFFYINNGMRKNFLNLNFTDIGPPPPHSSPCPEIKICSGFL